MCDFFVLGRIMFSGPSIVFRLENAIILSVNRSQVQHTQTGLIQFVESIIQRRIHSHYFIGVVIQVIHISGIFLVRREHLVGFFYGIGVKGYQLFAVRTACQTGKMILQCKIIG